MTVKGMVAVSPRKKDFPEGIRQQGPDTGRKHVRSSNMKQIFVYDTMIFPELQVETY